MESSQKHQEETKDLEVPGYELEEYSQKLLSLSKTSPSQFSKLLTELVDRAYREGKGYSKVACLNVLEEARLQPKEVVGITYLQEKIQQL